MLSAPSAWFQGAGDAGTGAVRTRCCPNPAAGEAGPREPVQGGQALLARTRLDFIDLCHV